MMIKISLLIGLVIALLWEVYQQYGISGLIQKESRGRHCARGRGRRFGRESAQHKDGTPVWNTITGAQRHILPSRYYSTVAPSRRGMAHNAA